MLALQYHRRQVFAACKRARFYANAVRQRHNTQTVFARERIFTDALRQLLRHIQRRLGVFLIEQHRCAVPPCAV